MISYHFSLAGRVEELQQSLSTAPPPPAARLAAEQALHQKGEQSLEGEVFIPVHMREVYAENHRKARKASE